MRYVRDEPLKFITPDTHGMICHIDSEVDFQHMYHMYHMYHMFSSVAIDLIVDTITDMVNVPSCSSFLS